MPQNESVDLFLRFLNERFVDLRGTLSNFVRALSQEDRPMRLRLAGEVFTRIDDLRRALSKRDQPAWLPGLESKIRWYQNNVASNPDAGFEMLQGIISLHQQIEAQKWDFTVPPTVNAIDFVAVFQECYRESRVPQLFAELIQQLETIIASGEIDSVQAIKQLEKLIATLKKNVAGDLFSVQGTWQFTQRFFKNFSLEILEGIPVLSPVVKALRKTMEDLEIEFPLVLKNIRERLDALANAELPRIRYEQLALPSAEDDQPEIAAITDPLDPN